MRLKLLTNLSSGLLLSVCLALAATLWWSERALDKPYQLLQQQLQLSQQFQQQIANNIQDYLDSGNAVRHSDALHAIDELQQNLQSLPASFAQRLSPSLLALQQFAATELLGAGKLAGDPQGLLIQAEREIASTLMQLQRYSSDSSLSIASHYQQPLFNAAQRLTRLSHARDKLLESGQASLADDLERELKALKQQAEILDQLPLLNVQEQNDNASDFASLLGLSTESTSQSQEDKGISLKRQLNSLLKRYPKELGNTTDLIEQRQTLLRASQEKAATLQQALYELSPLIHAEQQQIQSTVRLVQGLVIGLILLTALGLDRIQRQLSHLLGQLAPKLSSWADGDFSRDVKLNTNIRELSDIEQSLSQLRSYLTQLIGTLNQNADAVASSSKTLARMSQNLHQGAQQQQTDTRQIRDALAQLESSISQVSLDANQSAEASRNASEAAEQGQNVIEQSLAGLHQPSR